MPISRCEEILLDTLSKYGGFYDGAGMLVAAQGLEKLGLAIPADRIRDLTESERRRAKGFWTYPLIRSKYALPVGLYSYIVSSPLHECPSCGLSLTLEGLEEYRKIELVNTIGLLRKMKNETEG